MAHTCVPDKLVEFAILPNSRTQDFNATACSSSQTTPPASADRRLRRCGPTDRWLAWFALARVRHRPKQGDRRRTQAPWYPAGDCRSRSSAHTGPRCWPCPLDTLPRATTKHRGRRSETRALADSARRRTSQARRYLETLTPSGLHEYDWRLWRPGRGVGQRNYARPADNTARKAPRRC